MPEPNDPCARAPSTPTASSPKPPAAFSEKPETHRADLGFRCVIEDPAPTPRSARNWWRTASPPVRNRWRRDAYRNVHAARPSIRPCWTATRRTCGTTRTECPRRYPTGVEGCLDGGMLMHNGELQHLYTCGHGTPPIHICGECRTRSPRATEHAIPGSTWTACNASWTRDTRAFALRVGVR